MFAVLNMSIKNYKINMCLLQKEEDTKNTRINTDASPLQE